MARTGYKVTVYLDDNPLSPTYMQTYEERVLDETSCPVSEDDLVLISNECEVSISGYTGYRLEIYYNRTTGEYVENRVLDSECEASSTEEQWVNSGSPYCETTEKGINTGYMLQLQVQMNPNLSNYGETRLQRYKSPECAGNNCAIWEDIQKQCHIEVIDCVATFDGTADISQIDNNPLSETYNQTRTINKQDSDCENCTKTTFSWVEVGTMCGDDKLLCSNGMQQVSTNSYTVTQKYKTIGNKTIPMDEYQVVLKTEDDKDCGYIKPQYKMEKAEGQYLCDYETYTKYEMLIRMVSYDAGVTWSVWYDPQTGEPHTERGEVIAHDSYDCGKPMYRWVPNGEFTCEDNGDDGKVRYYNSFSDGEFSDLSTYVPCNESDVLSGSEVTSVQQTLYRRVGDCVRVVSGTNITKKSGSGKVPTVWLGDYTEEIGGITEYEGITLDIPERVKKLTRIDRTTTFENIVMMPQNPVSATSVFQNGANGYCAIWVAADVYDTWHDDEYWGRFSGSSTTAKLLPMNNDTVSWKAKVEMKSDFNEWAYFIPDGEDSTTITSEEGKYGRAIMTKITLSDKIRTISSNSFGDRNNGYREAARLKEIDFGHGIETIGSSAFSYNYFTSVHIPGSVRTIGNNAFFNYVHTISSITFDNGIETIGSYAFSGHTCSAITLPDSIKTIGYYSFYGSKGLVRLEIGSGCTSIEGSVVKSVSQVVVKALTPPTVRSDSFGGNQPGEILVPCESYEDYVEQWTDFASRISTYGCSGVEVKIAVLHQTDGTDIEITKSVDFRRKILKPSDIDPYSSTTSAITVTEECTEFAIMGIYDYRNVAHITFEGVVPPEFTSLYENTRFVNDNQVIYVPCEGYDIYRFIFDKNLTDWDDVDKLVRISDGCIGDLQYEWVAESSWCNSESGKAVETQRKHLIWGGESYPTIETRDVESTDCIEISNNGFTFDTDNTWNGHDSSTMSFKYLVDGGYTVTIYQHKGVRPYFYVYANTSIYDGSGNLVATTDGHGLTLDVELESNKTYTVKNIERITGGSGKIKFNI